MATAKRELQEIIEPAVTALGYELVGCEVLQDGKRCVLRVYVDAENGITIGDISKVSRQISAVLEVEDPMKSSRYALEVSSPGLDRPLYQLEHYRRFVGSMVKLRLRVPKGEDHRRNYSGLLVGVEDRQITLKMDDDEQISLDFDEIEKANLIPEF